MAIKPSQEQINIVKAVVRGESMLVPSYAGCSKSYTSALAIKHLPNKRIVALTFNKHLAEEAEEMKEKYKFKNFFPMTVHKMAKTFTIDTGEVTINGKSYKWRPKDRWKCFKPFIHSNDMRGMVSSQHGMWDLSKEFTAFCKNVSQSFKDVDKRIEEIFIGSINRGVITHDMYLKLFLLGLNDGSISLANTYDVFLLDEMQDSFKAIGHITKNHGIKQTVLLGDKCISPYTRIHTKDGWRLPKPIYDRLVRGEKVEAYCYDQDTGEYEFKPMKTPRRHAHEEDMLTVTTDCTTATTTAEHRYLTNNGYRRGYELEVGDLIVNSNQGRHSHYVKPSDDTYQFILGAFLGDGHIDYQKHGKFRVNMGHSEAQFDYLKWKTQNMQSNCIYNKIKGGERIIRGSKCTVQDSYTASTRMMITDEKISISSVLNHLSPLGLAIWLMDDGSVKAKNGSKITGITLSSNTFTKDENLLLIEMLKSKLGLDCVLGRDREYYEINFRTKEVAKLLDIVGKYIHKDFKKFGDFGTKYSNTDILQNVSVVLKTEMLPYKKTNRTHYVYDFEVEKNHNFVISDKSNNLIKHGGMVVHNCQSINEFLLKGYNLISESWVKRLPSYKLSQSFRCTNEVCNIAKYYALDILEPNNTFYGFDRPIPPNSNSHFYLCRTNVGGFEKAIQLLETEVPFTTSIDLKEVRTKVFDYVALLHVNGESKTTVFTRRYLESEKGTEYMSDNCIKDVLEYQQTDKEDTLIQFMESRYGKFDGVRNILKIIKKSGKTLTVLIEEIEEHRKLKTKPDIHITTTFKAKGSSTDTVTMLNDFTSPAKLEELLIESLEELVEGSLNYSGNIQELMTRFKNTQEVRDYRSELMLVYVSISRARFKVNLPTSWNL